MPIGKLLVANRGEIAVRVIRCARELGIPTVAICSEVDREAFHARLADEAVVVGPAVASRSYLDVDAVIAAARATGSDAIHPGYGFLSERASFAERVEDEGLTFVGPSAGAIRLMGDKAAARRTAQAAGVPTVPGSDGAVRDGAHAREVASRTGLPVALKAAGGGGGRGIMVVEDASDLEPALTALQAEAGQAFGDPSVYLERFLTTARHVEVQVVGDGDRVIHIGERDCSIQRRRQKLIEETPAPGLPVETRAAMVGAAVRLASEVSYRGAATVEFLYDPVGDAFHFIEMNTRIQVEHPISEAVSGLDLIAMQLRIAGGEPLGLTQSEVQLRGHAIELRINAEDPDRGFHPTPGRIEALRWPAGPHVRVDAGYEPGDSVSPYYDSLLGKVVVTGGDRAEALARAERALSELEVVGVSTTRSFCERVLRLDAFRDATHDTLTVARLLEGDERGA